MSRWSRRQRRRVAGARWEAQLGGGDDADAGRRHAGVARLAADEQRAAVRVALEDGAKLAGHRDGLRVGLVAVDPHAELGAAEEVAGGEGVADAVGVDRHAGDGDAPSRRALASTRTADESSARSPPPGKRWLR